MVRQNVSPLKRTFFPTFDVCFFNRSTEIEPFQLEFILNLVQTFESVDKNLKRDHSNESYWAVISWGAVYVNAAWAKLF